MPRTLTRRRYEKATAERHRAALDALRLDIPLGPGRQTLPADEQILRYLDRLCEFYQPANLFQSSFTLFRTRCCYTVDEAAGGRVALMPDWPYMREVDDYLITDRRLFIEKSRRVLASWQACCMDIWIAAGGQDPRWPELMNATGNRRVIIAARKLEDAGGSAEYLEKRVKFILDQFEERGLRKLWPDFPTWTYRFGQVAFSNGATIDAIAQGKDQGRGPAATFWHVEEVAFMPEAGPTINAAIPTLRGGGHVLCITTPETGTWAHKLRDGKLGQVGAR